MKELNLVLANLEFRSRIRERVALCNWDTLQSTDVFETYHFYTICTSWRPAVTARSTGAIGDPIPVLRKRYDSAL